VPELPSVAYACSVSCQTCGAGVWQGNDPPADGQPLLTEYADLECRRADCPHRTATRQAAELNKVATQRDLAALGARIDKLEARRP
jgi:hypothetical protein